MADPLSISASVLALTTAVIQTSKVLFEITKGFKTGLKEIKAISRDAQSLHATLCPLRTALKAIETRTMNTKDDAVLGMITGLMDPLSSCEIALAELVSKLQKVLKCGSKDAEERTSITGVKWVLYLKNDIRDLQFRLETAKATLNTALSGISALGGLHLITTSDFMGPPLTNKIIKIPGDQKFTIRRFIQEDMDNEQNSSTMLRTATELSDSGRGMNYLAETARSKAQTLKLTRRSCQETQNLIHSEGIPLSQCPTRVHLGLAENQLLLGHIQEAIQCKETHGKGKIMDTRYQLHGSEDEVYAPTGHNSGRALICSRSEPCPDDVSESSEGEFYSFDDNCSEHYCPSPAGFLESSSSFYPESYIIDSLFKDPLFVISEKRSDIRLWTKQYFILYAKTPRQWMRLTVSATFEGLSYRASIFGADVSHDSEQQDITLPHVVWDYTIRHLSQVSHFMLVTNLSLFFKQDESGSLSHDQTRSSIREDCMEVRSSGEDQILRDIEDLGCKQFLESEIITQSRKSSSCFIVRVESRTCIERKAPFVNSGMRGANGFQKFFRDLKFLKSLGGCSGVAEFVGVVLDNTRTQLRSYIYEYPALGTVLSLFLGAQSKREIIPWRIRESWARQLVEAVADIHGGKGSLVGGLCWLDEIGIRANGTIVLTAL